MANKKYNVNNEKDYEELRKLLEDDVEDSIELEDLGHESDIASEDNLEIQDFDRTSEQACSDDSEDEYINTDVEGAYILGKDKHTKWMRKQASASRKGKENIMIYPGVIGVTKYATTAVECWNNFFTDNILEIIVKYTNQCIENIKKNFSRERDIKLTDITELRAFIGLLYLAGAYKRNRLSLEELWGRENDGIEKFGLVMSFRRFKTLVRYLRFDDQNTREQRKSLDRLCHVRDIFEIFVKNCQTNYSPGENVTIDEMLPSFKGKCPFRQYMPSKPNKYGIKLFSLVDTKMSYTFNLEIYAGKQPDGPYNISNKPTDVVKRLVQPLGVGRNITADNWFTDLRLVHELKAQKLTYVGSIKKNNRALPPSFVNTKSRKQYDSMFGYNNGNTLVSYIPRKQENVLLLSSLHNDHNINSSTNDNKPEILKFYNETKGGVDTVDQMCSIYNVSRHNKRWPMVIFYTMLNIAGINSMVVYLDNGLAPMRRRLFIKKLAHELTLPELQRRSMKKSGMHSALQMRLQQFKRNVKVENADMEEPPFKRVRCTPCTTTSGFRRMTTHRCAKCVKPICNQHSHSMCSECSELFMYPTFFEQPE